MPELLFHYTDNGTSYADTQEWIEKHGFSTLVHPDWYAICVLTPRGARVLRRSVFPSEVVYDSRNVSKKIRKYEVVAVADDGSWLGTRAYQPLFERSRTSAELELRDEFEKDGRAQSAA